MSETGMKPPDGGKMHWKRLGKYLMLVLSGILINLILSQTAGWLKLPMYLDCIGTILVSMIGGFVPGIVVGYATNLLKMIFDADSIYYCAINVLIAVLAALLHRKNWFRTWRKTLLSVPLFALIGGGLGSLLTLVMYGFNIAEDFTGLLAQQINNTLHSVFASQVISSIVFDLLDKLITVVIAVLIYRALSGVFKDLFRYNNWLQNPLSREDYKQAERFRPRGMSLRTKIVLVLSISILVIAAVTTGISYYTFRGALIQTKTEMAEGVSNLAATKFDPERIREYLRDGEKAPGYIASEMELSEIRNSSADIKYIYVYQIREDGCHVVFDPDFPEMAGDDPGALVEFDDAFRPQMGKLLTGEEIEPVISNSEEYGWLLSVYTPVKNSEDITVCYACVDIDMTQLQADEFRFLARILSLFVSLAVLILAVFLWYAEQGVIMPINSMAIASESFAFNSEEERAEGAEALHSLGIHTGDEIENLYEAIMKTTDDSLQYIAESQEKNEIITRMQENLIITMADLVESRDQNTGDHIKNTAEYTRIIMEELRKEGHYTDQLTDEYMADVFRSAPLHDIGKIKIPDAVLNKPGKLTDEEFALMKKHTTYGGEVIEKTRPASGNISYLDVAKDLATYHHEWWNGRGYPEGLKGEEIPLSARIMAVADVFDALISKRCYKDGFSFEKSMDIIREESGTHFDPLVAGAFLNATDEVRKVVEQRQEQPQDEQDKQS